MVMVSRVESVVPWIVARPIRLAGLQKTQVCRETHLGSSLAENRDYFFFLVVATVVVLLRSSASFTEINRPVFASRPIVVVVSFLVAMLSHPLE